MFDPCTVITVGVFDNCTIADKTTASRARDFRIGRFELGFHHSKQRVHTYSYPLAMLHTSGVKKMGEMHLAVRFSCANMGYMLHSYAMPLSLKIHYVHPLSVNQLNVLMHHAMNVVAPRLSHSDPSLGREVVKYMLDHDSRS